MKSPEPDQFFMVGNNLALDFVNSIMFDLTADVLASWVVAADVAPAVDRDDLAVSWSKQTVDPVLAFRKTLRAAVERAAEGREQSQNAIDAVNNILKQGHGYSIVRGKEGGFVKDHSIDLGKPKNVLLPIAEAFADLLCYGNLELLRKCENPKCVLYFYDTTKNHRRRWCSMAVCGNQAKARKFYQKSKQHSAA